MDKIDPIDPMDRIDPIDPIERIDPAEPALISEPTDPSDTTEPAEYMERTDQMLRRDSMERGRNDEARAAAWRSRPGSPVGLPPGRMSWAENSRTCPARSRRRRQPASGRDSVGSAIRASVTGPNVPATSRAVSVGSRDRYRSAT
jgi:hypothetical protein